MTEVRATALVRAWTPRLREAGVDTPRLDAELLVAHALGCDRHRMFLDDPILDEAQLARAEALLRHRAAERVPVAYLTETRWFDDIELHVDRRVLVPRPETELLVELAVALAPQDATVIDVGTGSGAVAISLNRRRPDLTITASDIDDAALDVARRNAERHAHADSAGLDFQHASLLGAWSGEVLVSNPPYVEETTASTLAPELGHEPQHALYAGADGLDVIRPLITQARERHVGLILLEHGHLQGERIRMLLVASGYRARTERDLASLDRVTWGLRDDLWPLTAEQDTALKMLA